jgi:PAS domain S-box-containing protein
MGRGWSRALGGLACALAGVAAVEAIVAAGLKTSHPLLLPCFGMIVGAYLFAVPGGLAASAVVLAYMAFGLVQPEHFPGFIGYNVVPLWVAGIPASALLIGLLRARADRAKADSLRATAAEAELRAARAYERQLKESEARFRAVFERSDAGIAIWGTDFVYLAVNDAMCRLLGYDAEEIVGKRKVTDDQPPDDEVGAQLAEKIRRGELRSNIRDRPLVGRDGTVHWVRVQVSAMPGPDSRPAAYVSIFVDITEAKKVQLQVEEMNRDLEQRVRQRTQELESLVGELEAFSYSVSHDLRAPLRAINSFARLLRDEEAGRLSAEGQRLLGVVETNARRMAVLVDGLLEFSRLGRQTIATSAIDMGALLGEVLRELDAGRAELRIGALPGCCGDSVLLRQVWSNLLSNAIKYSRGRDAPVIEAGYDDAQGAYFVRDNGVGFDMQYAEKLFDVFQRLHGGPEFEGSGVGLAIVKRIVQRHGGRVWARSAPGEGATFYFSVGSGENSQPWMLRSQAAS